MTWPLFTFICVLVAGGGILSIIAIREVIKDAYGEWDNE